MPIELKIPEMGESISEVQIAEWLKAEGDPVQKDETVAVLDSEKTTLDFPAPASGTLVRILHQGGTVVRVGEVIGLIEEGGAGGAKPAGKAPAGKKPTGKKPPAPAKAVKADKAAADEPAGPAAGEPEEASVEEPAATSGEGAEPEPAKVASEPKSDAPKVASARTPPAAPREGEELVPMSMLRRTVAKRLVAAKQQMAMVTTFGEVNLAPVKALRSSLQEAFQERYKVKLGFMPFFVKAAVDALRRFPQLNAEIRGDAIAYRNYFNIGVAVATEHGLVVPVLQHAEHLGFADIESAIAGFAKRAKDARLVPADLEGATFTITNGGVFGSLFSTPIISPPQAGILGMHAIQERPVAENGQVVIRPMMYLALTYDHRLVDGREAVLFLQRIKETIECPERLLLEV